jgi:electron transfer flavoprotein alpha subunit
MSEIWVVSEQTATVLELIAHAKGLAQGEKIVAWTFSPVSAQQAAKHGADLVIHLNGENRPEAWVNTIIERAKQTGPDVILWGTSKRAKEMAARVAAALDTGLITECIKVQREQEFISERYIYGGLCVATESTNNLPFMATMAAKLIEALPESPTASIEVVSGAYEVGKVVEMRANLAISNLGDANVVVCVGRGVAKEEDLALAQRLAKALGGEVGCTRPVAEDLHWMPEENYIGISGKVIKPTVYIGLGVSGQIQHVAGIRDAKTIIAIEKNENAPILEAADYGLVGDLYEILPALLSALGV